MPERAVGELHGCRSTIKVIKNKATIRPFDSSVDLHLKAMPSRQSLDSKRPLKAISDADAIMADQGRTLEAADDASRKRFKRQHASPVGDQLASAATPTPEGNVSDLSQSKCKEQDGIDEDVEGANDLGGSTLLWTARSPDTPIVAGIGKHDNIKSGWGRLPKPLLQ